MCNSDRQDSWLLPCRSVGIKDCALLLSRLNVAHEADPGHLSQKTSYSKDRNNWSFNLNSGLKAPRSPLYVRPPASRRSSRLTVLEINLFRPRNGVWRGNDIWKGYDQPACTEIIARKFICGTPGAHLTIKAEPFNDSNGSASSRDVSAVSTLNYLYINH